MQEKRRHKRYAVDIMNILGKTELSTMIKILDISISSVKLAADVRLNIGKIYIIKFDDKENHVTVKGTVESSMISETLTGADGDIIPMYTAVIAFENLLPEKANDLVSFIESYKRDEEQRLSALRFNISSPEKIMMIADNYKVKKISLGGALIECETCLEPEKIYSMQIALPEHTPITFWGRIASCISIKDANTEKFEMGIQFLDIPDKDLERLRDFIKMLDSMDNNLHDPWSGTRKI